MTTDAAFWDKIAPNYAKSPISDMDGYRDTLTRTLRHLCPTDRVLEIGCGTGSTALEIAPHVAELVATDLSPMMIEIAREKLWDRSLRNVRFLAAPAEASAPAEDAAYDAILAMNLLHLVPDQDAVLRQAHAMLKPGGLFISKTPCLGGKWYLRPMIGVMRAVGKAPKVLHQRLDDLRAAIEGHGFEMVEEFVQTGSVPRLYVVARKL